MTFRNTGEDLLGHFLFHEAGRQEPWVLAIAVHQHFGFAADEEGAAIRTAEGFAVQEFIGSHRKETSVHPGELYIAFTVFARVVQVDDGGGGISVGVFCLFAVIGPGSGDAAFHGGGEVDGEKAEDRVHEVAGHVSQGACAEGVPATPVERQVGGMVVNIFCRAQPEVPVQLRGNVEVTRGCGEGLRPYGTVSPYIDLAYFAQHAGVVHFFGLSDPVAGAALVAHLGDYFITFGGVCEQSGFKDVVGEGFLRVDVLAQLHSRQCGDGMDVVRRGYGAGVDVLFLFFQHFPEVLVVFCFWEALSGFGRAAVVHVAKRDDVHFRAGGEFFQVASPFAADADACDVQFIAGRHEAAAQYVAGYDDEAACGKGSVFHEFPSGKFLLSIEIV